MSGKVAPIEDIIYLAKKYNALTFCDEFMGIGIYGKYGGGMTELMDL